MFCFDALQMDMDMKLFGGGMDVKPGTPPIGARSTTPTSSHYRYRLSTHGKATRGRTVFINVMMCKLQKVPPVISTTLTKYLVRLTRHVTFRFASSSSCRASSTSPSSQSSKINSMLYQKQFQASAASMRMAQHFPGQFNPQVESRPLGVDCV